MKLKYLFVILALLQLLPWGLLLALAGSDIHAATLVYILEALSAVNIVLLVIFYRKLLRPLDTLAGGLDIIRSLDWNSTLVRIGQPEVDKIADTFNEMLAKLKHQRIRYEERSHFINLLVEAAPVGVVIEREGKEPIANPAAARFPVSREQLSTIPPGEEIRFRTPSGALVRCSCNSFTDRGMRRRFYLLDDITAAVDSAQQEAYGKIIRIMAHEVNNTMTGLDSVLSAAIDELPDPELRTLFAACLNRSKGLTAFIGRYAEVVKLPPPRLTRISLPALLAANRTFLESMALPMGVKLNFHIEHPRRQTSPFEIDGDPEQLTQALINIVKNSLESILLTGRPDGEITISLSLPTAVEPQPLTNTGTRLTVADNGAGISADKAAKLFQPFFTDKPDGQGIGLTLVREILASHRATYTLATSPADHLTRFTILFP